MMRYKLCIFDLDGTLLDSLAHIVRCHIDTCIKMGIEQPDFRFIRRGIGLPITDQVQRLFPEMDNQKKSQFLEIFKQGYYGYDSQYELFSGVIETLTELKSKGVFLAIATGMSRRGLDEVLEKTGLGDLMDASRCADECPSKPDPAMLLELMDQVGVAPNEALMVGDTQYDVLAAKNAEIPVLVVNYGAHDIERLEKLEPLGVISLIDEVCGYVANS